MVRFCRSYQPELLAAQAVVANSIAYLVFTTEDTEEHRVGRSDGPRYDARSFYFFRSTKNLANSFNVSACSPKLSSSANASFTSASALRSEASIPNSAG